jgi:DNA-binding XRE family transcriptional regulator
MKNRQVRAARELLGMSQVELSKAAGISRPTLQAIESETGDPKRSSLVAVETYLRSRGIRFSDEPGIIGTPPAEKPI